MAVIVFLAGASRIFPHPPNFSPILAIALFGAAHFSKKWQAVFIPMLAVWLSDLFINNFVYSNQCSGFIWFYSGFYWQYASYLIIIMSSILFFKNKISISKTLGASLGSSMTFFLLFLSPPLRRSKSAFPNDCCTILQHTSTRLPLHGFDDQHRCCEPCVTTPNFFPTWVQWVKQTSRGRRCAAP